MRIGIVGAGIGGLSAAIALQQCGHEVTVFEQASVLGHVGADINLTPNSVRALDGLGVGGAIRAAAARPKFRISRVWDTGEETSRLPMSDAAELRYGAPQLTLHRADLVDALRSKVHPGRMRLGHRVRECEEVGESVVLRFAGASEERFDVVIGADGIHSAVRHALFGEEHPTFTGVVAFRSVVPLGEGVVLSNVDSFTKWWGDRPEVQIVTFPLNRGRDMFVFATTPQESWTDESWTTPGSVEELRSFYRDFHPEARAYLDLCSSSLKSALYVRDPLERWSVGRTTLVGDACHPMTPFMAQGAGQAIEDGVILARSLEGVDGSGVTDALVAYERSRLPRTSRIQLASRENSWLKSGGDADWLYEYDAWNVPVGPSDVRAGSR